METRCLSKGRNAEALAQFSAILYALLGMLRIIFSFTVDFEHFGYRMLPKCLKFLFG